MTSSTGTDPKAGSHTYALMFSVPIDQGIKKIPVVGEAVPDQYDVKLDDLRIVGSTAKMTNAQVKLVNTAIGSGKHFPDLVDKGLTIEVDVDVPGTGINVVRVNLGGDKKTDPAPTGHLVHLRGDTPVFTPVDAAYWKTIDKTLGPLKLDRVGGAFQDGRLWFLLDASLTAGGLKLDGTGMGLGITLKSLDGGTPDVKPALTGVGVSFDNKPLDIGGALITKDDPGYNLYLAGAAVLRTPALGFRVAGAYIDKKDGTKSFFLFGGVQGKMETGFPPFEPYGIALGFGYNSDLRIPDISEVDSFPLLKMLSDGAALPDDPLKVLDDLVSGDKPWLKEKSGQMWGAAGLAFTSCSILDCRALGLFEFGDALTIALVGSATAKWPKETDKPYGLIDLDMKAVYSSAENLLSFDAKLTPKSFIVDGDCKLHGSAAVRAWLPGSEHAGDFVITMGGYHPHYDKPAHYPSADRIGIDWKPGGGVTLKADGYLAVTPAQVMAGLSLDVLYELGVVSAHFAGHIDAVIGWAPFAFDVQAGVSISATLHILFPITAEIDADLHLWGPPTGGQVKFKVCGYHIDIPFGSPASSVPASVSWAELVKEALPAAPLSVQATTGLLNPRPDDDGKTWRFPQSKFSLSTNTAVPASHVTVCGSSIPQQKTSLDVRPMAKTGVKSTHTVKVELVDGDKKTEVGPDAFLTIVRPAAAPAALWGGKPDSSTPAEPSKQLIGGMGAGVTLTALPAQRYGAEHLLRPDQLMVQPVMPDGPQPFTNDRAASFTLKNDPHGLYTMAAHVHTIDAISTRSATLALLAKAGLSVPKADDSMGRLTTEASQLFPANLMDVVPAGSTA